MKRDLLNSSDPIKFQPHYLSHIKNDVQSLNAFFNVGTPGVEPFGIRYNYYH